MIIQMAGFSRSHRLLCAERESVLGDGECLIWKLRRLKLHPCIAPPNPPARER